MYHTSNMAGIRKRIVHYSLFLFFLLGLYCALVLSRPLPLITASTSVGVVASETPVLVWPKQGQASVGAVGYGLLASYGQQKPVPVASTAKIITALAVLNKKPLDPGSQGPVITLGADDMAAFRRYQSLGGSVVAVTPGEKITQYQALEAMLLPSANNIAYSLSVWAFGSAENYLNYVNQYVKTLGLTQTYLADASGLSPQTVSTAHDLAELALLVQDNPVITEIVGKKKAVVPVAGTVNSTNWLLGVDGISGIKTGNTDEAGGCYMFSVNRTIGGKKITIVGAVIGSPSLQTAMADARTLASSSVSGFKEVKIVNAGDKVGAYNAPWGESVPVLAQKDLVIVTWTGLPIPPEIKLNKLNAPAQANQLAGMAEVSINGQLSTTELKLAEPISRPSNYWRLLHPF